MYEVFREGYMRNLILSCMLVLAGGAFQFGPAGQNEKKSEHYSAVAIGTGGSVGGASLWIDIYIEEYTSDEEAIELLTVLKEQGQDALRRRLEKLNKGRINPQRGIGVTIAAARVIESETARIVRVFAARPMPFLELYHGGRSTDYPIGLIELLLDKDGAGQGAVVAAAKVKITEDGRFKLESLGNQYVKLVNVRLHN